METTEILSLAMFSGLAGALLTQVLTWVREFLPKRRMTRYGTTKGLKVPIGGAR